MEKEFELFLQKVKKDRTKLKELKKMAASCSEYLLAAKIREIEEENFPGSLPDKTYCEIKTLRGVFKMLGFDLDEKTVYITLRAIRDFESKGEHFDLRSASKILVTAEKYFW